MTPVRRLTVPHAPSDGERQPSPAEAPTTPHPAGHIVIAVARSELPRLLRRPLVVFSVGLAVALFWWRLRLDAPVLDRDSVRLVGWFLPVAAATLVAGHGMASRSRRGRVAELLDTLPTSPERRILGEALAVLGPVVLATVFLGAGMVFLATGDPVGDWHWWELATAPLMVLLAGVLGVTLGQWLPNRVTPYLAVVALGYLQLWAHPHVDWEISEHVGALTPFQQMNLELPYLWQGRSPAAHVGWLVALTAVLLAVAALRWGRTRWVMATLVVGIGAAVLTGTAAVAAVTEGPSPEIEAHLDAVRSFEHLAPRPTPEGVYTCHLRETYEVCAVIGYAGWIPRWEATFQRIDRVAPSTIEQIRQSPRWHATTDDATVVPTIEWDRGDSAGSLEFELGLQIATRAMTSSETFPAGDDEDWHVCSFAGEARAAVMLWLAAHDAPGVAEELERRVGQARSAVWYEVAEDGTQHIVDSSGDLWIGMESSRMSLVVPDGELALAMLDLPLDEVRRTVRDDLQRWQEPAVSGADLAAALGLPPPEPVTDPGPHAERCP